MSSLVLLDSTPVGFLVHSRSDLRERAERWLSLLRPAVPTLPEIVWYELRRELLRLGSSQSVERLDLLRAELLYARVTSAILRRATELWAETRRMGRPTAADAALDIDVIVAATALDLQSRGHTVVVATGNVAHLGRFVAAELWEKVASPEAP